MNRNNSHPADTIKNPAFRRGLRLLLEILLAVSAAFLIELCLNLPSLTGNQRSVDLTENSAMKDGKLTYTKTFDTPVYLKKLILKGTFSKNISYKVLVTAVNSFGQEETVEITDKAYKIFDSAYTNISQKAAKITVTFSKPEALTLDSLTCTNQVSFSPYRILFFVLVCFTALFLFLEHQWLVKRVEILYLICALGFGSLIIAASGAYAVTWDEEVHYKAVCMADFGSADDWNPAELANTERLSITVNTIEELQQLNRYMDALAQEQPETQTAAGFSLKSYVNYFPIILFYRIGKFLRLPYTMLYSMGRFGNLLFCVLLCFTSIRLAKRKKFLISVICTMPTVLFQCSMYTYDGIIFSCLTLGFVLCMNQLETAGPSRHQWPKYLLILGLFAAGCLAKPVYAPAFLLIPALFSGKKKLPRTVRKKKLPAVLLAGGAVVFMLLLAFLCLRPVLSNILNGNISYGGDTRGGDTGIAGQLLSILRHPLAFLKLMLHEMFTMDNFRNFGDPAKNQFSVLILMFLNLYVLGNLKDAWILILLPLLLLLFLAEPEGEPALPPYRKIRKIRRLNAVILILSILLVWTAMYLAFTPIGSQSIEGVQTRYFLPLFLPAAYALWNQRVQVHISRSWYFRITWGAELLLTGVCFYQTLILGRTV